MKVASRNLFPEGQEKENKERLAQCFILHRMSKENIDYSIMLELEDKPLDKVFRTLLRDEYVKIKRTEFIITQKGLTLAKSFADCYKDFLDYYDVYCAVDLEAGLFAFEQVHEYGNDEVKWQNFLKEERFEDLRLTVAEYVGISPTLLLFIVFLKEGRFSSKMKEHGWQHDLMVGTFWNDMEKIFNSSLYYEGLGYTDERNNIVSGSEVIDDILVQGQRVIKHIKSDHIDALITKNNHNDCWDKIF